MRATCLFFACALASGMLGQTPAQEVRIRGGPYAPPGAVISVQSNLVEMTATVRDHKGQLTGGLSGDDFELFDNGKPSRITVFSEQHAGRAIVPAGTAGTELSAVPPSAGAHPEAPAARAVALFFDDMHIGALGLSKAKIAAHKLVESGMHADDRVAVYTDSGDVVLDLTADRRALTAAVDRIRPHPQRGAAGVAACPTLTPYQAYVIAKHLDLMALNIAVAEKIACDNCRDETCEKLAPESVQATAADTWSVFQYQSTIPLDVLKIVVRSLSHAPGQRILLMVSPGFITGGMERQTAAIADQAVRAHVVINALDSEGLMTGRESPESTPTPRHEKWAERTLGMRQMLLTGLMNEASAATGGRFIQNTNDFEGSLGALTAAPEVSYLIAFSPVGEPDNKYHSLKLRLKNATGYQVESRPGYFSAKAETPGESAQDRIDRIAKSGEIVSPFPTAVRVTAPDAATIRVDIVVDVRRLKFPKKEGRSVQEFTFVTMLEDAAGNFIAGKQSVMDMALTNATLAALQKDGMHAVTQFAAPRGSYRVREIVREAAENRIAASNTRFDAK
jgi:VWFA-related protein